MQLEKMTKIPDLLDLVRLSEKAESCWIKYEYLFHLVKMSDSVFSSFKVGDSSEPDSLEYSSCECDKSDYEHSAYSPNSSARWTPEEPPEYFVVAGKKPLSLVFKRSRSNSPVLKPKSCKSPLSNSKLADNKALLDCEQFDCRKNLDSGKLDITSSCECVLNSTKRICTCNAGKASQYLHESLCCVKDSVEVEAEKYSSDKCHQEGKENKYPELLGNGRIKSGGSSGIISSVTVTSDNIKSDEVKFVWNGSHEALANESSLQKNIFTSNSKLPVAQDVAMSKMSFEFELNTDSKSVDHGADSSELCSFQNENCLQSNVNDDSHASKVLGVFTSELLLEGKEVQNCVTSPHAFNSDSSLPDGYISESRLSLSDVKSSIDCGMETQLVAMSSPSIEVEQQDKLLTATLNSDVCASEMDTVVSETSSDERERQVDGNTLSQDVVDLPKMFLGLQVGKEDANVVLNSVAENSSLQKELNSNSTPDVQQCISGTIAPLEVLESTVPNLEVSALTPSEIIDIQLTSEHTVSVVGDEAYHVVSSATAPVGSETTVCDVSFSMMMSPVLTSGRLEGVDVSEGSAVEDCRLDLFPAVVVDTSCNPAESHEEVDSELMERDSYEAVGSIEVLVHLKNPIDVSPECINSDDELEILEVKGRAAYGNVATASHNLFPWDLEKHGSFSFPGEELQDDDVEMVAGASLQGDKAAICPIVCSLEESSCSQNGPPYSDLSNDPFICGLSRDSDDVLSPGMDSMSDMDIPAIGRAEDTENACDRFLFEDKSECNPQIDEGQFLCPVDMNSALPFGEVDVKDDRAFGVIGTVDGASGLEASGSDSRTQTPRMLRAPARESSKGKSVQQTTTGTSRKGGKKKERLVCDQTSSSCESSQVYGFSEETMDRIFDDSSGDVYRERSPLLYSSDEEKLYSEAEEECGTQSGVRGVSEPCHEKRRLSRLQELVSGVPPPPTVTFPQFCVDAMAARLQGFSFASPEGVKRASRWRSQNCTSEEVAKQTKWPDSKYCSYHGITYNNGRLSEEMELLSQKLCDRFVGSETSSSLVGVPPAPVPGSKGGTSLRRSSRDKGHSPGRRLSHLARRRQTFSSSNLLTAPPTDKRVILVDSRPKDRSKSQTSGKRSGPEPGKVSVPSAKTSKRSLYQTPPNNKSGPDVKVSVNSSKPTRRALFKSPPAAQQSTVAREREAPVRVETSRRALWPATGALHGIENCAKDTGKRQRSSDGREQQTTNAKCPRRSSRTPTKGSENRGKANQNDLSSPHRKKLLWAVAESLRSVGIGMQHPRFRACASALARLCRDLLLAQPAAPPRTGSTSEHMLRLANKHVREVIRAQPA